jgi:hypothetical protein
MANDNAEKAPEEKSKDVGESKSAESCTRECLQFEWLNSMGTKLPGARDNKQPSGLSDLTITPDADRRAERSADQFAAPGSAADQSSSKVPGEQNPDKDGDQSRDKPASGKQAVDPAAPRDVRKEIIHLAEYGHCSFASREEYRETLDQVMKEFTEKPDVSDRNKLLQSMVADFLKNPNQETYADFHKKFNAFFMQSSRLARETLRELDAEKTKNLTPERIKAEQDVEQKSDAFFKELDKLPKEEKDRILCTMDWQDEVSKEERNARTREALAGNPKLLEAFNASQASIDKRDSMRSPREAQLAELHRQNVRDNVLARSISTLLLHRSCIS